MTDKIIFKIVGHEASQLLQSALLLSESKDEAAKILNEIFDEALRQLWRVKE